MRHGAVGLAVMGTGTGLLLGQMAAWSYLQNYFSVGEAGFIQSFFVVELAALAALMAGTLYALRGISVSGKAEDYSSLSKIASDAFNSKTDRRLGLVAGAAYAVFYAFVSSVVVYQPSVNFAEVYRVTGPGWAAAGCCGSFGTTPSVTYFVSPQSHLALQFIPLDLAFLVLLPVLVGLNVSVGSFAFRNRPKQRGGAWLGGLGALVALFTSCPTCAGYFLAGAVGGVGATSIAVVLAPYQLLFIAVSVPVLVAAPILAASALRKAYLGGCPVEGRVFEVSQKATSAGSAPR